MAEFDIIWPVCHVCTKYLLGCATYTRLCDTCQDTLEELLSTVENLLINYESGLHITSDMANLRWLKNQYDRHM